MFTGIVNGLGTVRSVETRGDMHIAVETRYDLRRVDIGASIACSGVCLTVIDKGNSGENWFAVAASAETLSKTTVGEWKPGSPVNLERAVRVGDELGGHIVTGHVDATAELVKSVPEGESTRMTFAVLPWILPLIAPKGSIALDGVSLTVNEVEGVRVGVNIIPHTRNMTTLGRLQPHARVNVEVDLLARYVQRLLKV